MQYSGPANPMGMHRAQVIGGDEESLRTFIAAHFGKSYIPSTEETIVTIGHLPDAGNLAELPIAQNVQIIGAVQRPQLFNELLLQADDEFRETFIQALKDAGWQVIPVQSSATRGFVTQTAEQALRLCHEERKLVMQLNFSDDNLAYITINQQRNPCSDPHLAHMRVREILPTLRPPQHIITQHFQHGGGGSSSGSVYSAVSVKTNAELTTIDEHYRQQLADHGWTPMHHHIDNHLAVSTWHVIYDEEPWRGLLLIMSVGDKGDMHLRLEMQVMDG